MIGDAVLLDGWLHQAVVSLSIGWNISMVGLFRPLSSSLMDGNPLKNIIRFLISFGKFILCRFFVSVLSCPRATFM